MPILPTLIDGGEVFGLSTLDDFQNGTPYANDGFVGYNFRKTAVASTYASNAHMPSTISAVWGNQNSIGFGIFWDNWTKLAQDTFTGTNGTRLNVHTMNVGGGWTEVDSTWQIQSNAAKVLSSGASSFAVCDPGIADVSIYCSITTPSSSFDMGLVFNFQDDANYWLLAGGFSGTWHLYKVVATTVTEITSGGTASTSTTYKLCVITSGNRVTVILDGSQLFDQTISSRPLKTLTKAGLRVTSGDPGTTFDDFSVFGGVVPQTVLTNGMTVCDKLCWLYTEASVNFTLPLGESDPFGGAGANAAQIAQVNAARAANPSKLLLYNGNFLDNPLKLSPQRVANDIAFLKDMPFDGITLDLKDLDDAYSDPSAVSYRLFTDTSYSYATISSLCAPLDGLDFGNLKYNYVDLTIALLGGSIGLSLPRIDFFDDDNWANILQNASNLAQVMFEIGLAGIWLDTEDYGSGWADYAQQPETASHTIGEYRVQSSLRGAQFIRALRAKHPQISLMSLVAPMFQTDNHTFYTGYELAGPFYQGMLQGVPISSSTSPGGAGLRGTGALLGS